jgi:hypothetical protein
LKTDEQHRLQVEHGVFVPEPGKSPAQCWIERCWMEIQPECKLIVNNRHTLPLPLQDGILAVAFLYLYN